MEACCRICHSIAFPVRPSPLATTFTRSKKRKRKVVCSLNVHGNCNCHSSFREFKLIAFLVSFLPFSFANERKRWQIFHPLAFRMEQLSTVQLDGLMYIAGIVDHSENDSSNFWCYDPNRNIWIEKAHIDLDGDKIHLCKAKHSIFVCNHQVGCLKYDEIADRWSQVSNSILQYDGKKTNRKSFSNLFQINFDVFGDADVTSFHLLDVIDCGNESYGILSTNRGHLFVDIVLSENHCSLSNFMEYYLDDIDSISTRLHLFIH